MLSFNDIAVVLPEIFLISMACIVLINDCFSKKNETDTSFWLTQLALLGAALLVAIGFAFYDGNIWWTGHVVRDRLSDVLKIVALVTIALGMAYSRPMMKARTRTTDGWTEGLYQGSFFLLALFGALGMMVLISAASFVTVYLGLELMSLSMYAMVAFERANRHANEAAMKYFVLGALASGLLLYGMSLLYGATGSLYLLDIANKTIQMTSPAENLILVFGLVFVVVGLAFKFGAVPFHAWVPDVYQGAPMPVTLYVGSAPKLAAMAMAIRLLENTVPSLSSQWGQMLAVVALLSIVLGNLVALRQFNIKRMLAYSTISHVGFIFLGILTGEAAGYGAALFYVIVYVITVLATFGLLLVMSQKGTELQLINDLKGLSKHNPWLACLLMITMLSMAGIPFLAGFYAKFMVLRIAVGAGLLPLVIVALVFSVIGAFYYLRVIKTMYMDDPEEGAVKIEMCSTYHILLSGNALLLVILGIYPTALMTLCVRSFG